MAGPDEAHIQIKLARDGVQMLARRSFLRDGSGYY